MRRALLLASAAALAACATARGPESSCRRFRAIVTNALGDGVPRGKRSFQLTLIDRADGRVVCRDSIEPTQALYPASTIKTLIAVAALRLVDRGALSLSTPVTIDEGPVFTADECKEREGDPSCATFGPGKVVTVDQLLTDMITISNNLATDQLIDVVGKPFLAETARELGVPSLHVVRKVYNNVDPEPDNPGHNSADAAGFTALFTEIATGRARFLSETGRAYLIDLLRRQHYHDYFDKEFPAGAVYYHKDGYTSRVVADTGFWYVGPDRAAILVGLAAYGRHDHVKERDAWAKEEAAAIAAFVRIGRETLALTGR